MSSKTAADALTQKSIHSEIIAGTSGTTDTISLEVELFDPPMCCPTGLCGPTLDQTLLDVSEMVQALKDRGIAVERYQMASHPHVFLKQPQVMQLVREKGMEAFPITVIAGRIVRTGAYLTREEMDQALLDAKGISR